MDFYDRVKKIYPSLTASEQDVLNYIVRSIQNVQGMKMHILAENCYVSTTTVARLIKKLGYDSYKQFTLSLRSANFVGAPSLPELKTKNAITLTGFHDEDYLLDLAESIKALSSDAREQLNRCMSSDHAFYFYGSGLDAEPAHYAYHLFTAIGKQTSFLGSPFEIQSALGSIKDGDVLFIYSYTGDDEQAIKIIAELRKRCAPVVVTVTQSVNSALQNLCDVDLYVFSRHVQLGGYDLSPRVSMIALTEILVHSFLSGRRNDSPC